MDWVARRAKVISLNSGPAMIVKNQVLRWDSAIRDLQGDEDDCKLKPNRQEEAKHY
jgi:hypothetical protein